MQLLLLCALVAAAAASSVSHVTIQRREGLQSPHGPRGYDQIAYGVQHAGAGGYGHAGRLSGVQYTNYLGYGQQELGLDFRDPYTGSAAFVRQQGNVQPSLW